MGQVQPGSMWHDEEQPSALFVLPSSQPSPVCMTPSPHLMQELEFSVNPAEQAVHWVPPVPVQLVQPVEQAVQTRFPVFPKNPLGQDETHWLLWDQWVPAQPVH